MYSYSRSCRETKWLKNWIVKLSLESRYIIGAKTVQLAGVKCINVLKKAICWNALCKMSKINMDTRRFSHGSHFCLITSITAIMSCTNWESRVRTKVGLLGETGAKEECLSSRKEKMMELQFTLHSKGWRSFECKVSHYSISHLSNLFPRIHVCMFQSNPTPLLLYKFYILLCLYIQKRCPACSKNNISAINLVNLHTSYVFGVLKALLI